jgi:hypothetical protein
MLTTKRGSIIHPTRQADYFLPRDQYSLAVLQFKVDGMLGVWAPGQDYQLVLHTAFHPGLQGGM